MSPGHVWFDGSVNNGFNSWTMNCPYSAALPPRPNLGQARGALINAMFTCVVDSDHNHWLNLAKFDKPLSGFIDSPVFTFDVGGGAIKEILSIV